MTTDSLIQTLSDVVDTIVEIYLGSVIKPFLKLHEVFYSHLNKFLRGILDDNKDKIPQWFTANFVTYFRTFFIIPTLLLLSWGRVVWPAVIVVLADFGDFFDGVLARFWVDMRKEKEDALAKKQDSPRSASPTSDDSYEVVTTGSPHSVPSWAVQHRNRTYGGFVDAVCDKAFCIPCWIFLLSWVPGTGYLRPLQYIVLWCLILAETASASIRFRAYFTSSGVAAPPVKGLDFSTSAVKADHIGKAKQTFEMLGTASFIIPMTRYFGLFLLSLAVPLAYESVRRKIKKRVMYVCATRSTKFDYHTLKFWMQVKGLGSKLLVGVGGKQPEMVLNACAVTSVDHVICEAPAKADLMFLEKQGIDFVVVLGSARGGPMVTDEVIADNRCLCMGEDGVVTLIKPKESKD